VDRRFQRFDERHGVLPRMLRNTDSSTDYGGSVEDPSHPKLMMLAALCVVFWLGFVLVICKSAFFSLHA
jgi:hypothetical protein